MDENELKTKYCPHHSEEVREYAGNLGYCVGSDCSQFRSVTFPVAHLSNESPTRTIAYCGLAGKP